MLVSTRKGRFHSRLTLMVLHNDIFTYKICSKYSKTVVKEHKNNLNLLLSFNKNSNCLNVNISQPYSVLNGYVKLFDMELENKV